MDGLDIKYHSVFRLSFDCVQEADSEFPEFHSGYEEAQMINIESGPNPGFDIDEEISQIVRIDAEESEMISQEALLREITFENREYVTIPQLEELDS
jgi:hypothetical protein